MTLQWAPIKMRANLLDLIAQGVSWKDLDDFLAHDQMLDRNYLRNRLSAGLLKQTVLSSNVLRTPVRP